VSAYFINWLRLIGSTDPDRHFHVVGNYITGLVLHQLNRDQVWQAIDEQRLGLVELPGGLSEPDWSHLSLRNRWTVKEVAAHVALQNTSWWSLPRASLDVVRAGGLNAAIDRTAGRHAQRSSTGDIISEIRDRVGIWRPLPTLTYRDTAVDYLVHSQDIAIPLGRPVRMRNDLAVIAVHRVWS
jgi:uncharacterized protein (TIGR03083 family)